MPACAGMTGLEVFRTAVRLRGGDELRDIPDSSALF